MRSKVRAYSHQGHGPRADQTGRIHISDFRQHPLTCERQPVHTLGAHELPSGLDLRTDRDGSIMTVGGRFPLSEVNR
jgi:hypothetical protein